MIFWIYLCYGDFTHLSRFGDFIWWCILILWHVYFGDVWFISAATVQTFYIYMLFEFWCEDVASISWIFILFACIIALIEIGRYKSHWKLLFTHVIRLKHTIKRPKYPSTVNCRRFHRQLTVEESNYADSEFCISQPNHFLTRFYL